MSYISLKKEFTGNDTFSEDQFDYRFNLLLNRLHFFCSRLPATALTPYVLDCVELQVLDCWYRHWIDTSSNVLTSLRRMSDAPTVENLAMSCVLQCYTCVFVCSVSCIEDDVRAL